MLYALVVYNMRAVMAGSYFWTATSDAMLSCLNFLVIRKIAEKDSLTIAVGYITGSVIGGMLGLWLSQRL